MAFKAIGRRYSGRVRIPKIIRSRVFYPLYFLQLPYRIQGVGFAIFKQLDFKNLPEVFICSGDTIAVYALISCDKLGIKVPRDLSIAGFDGVQVELYSPWLSALTSMRQPLAEMGKFAVKRLLKIINDPDEPPQKTLFHTVLIPGETVKTGGSLTEAS